MKDVYHEPEAFGLTPIGDVDWSDGCYQFSMTAVWRDQDGNLLWGEDSGCSCPSPFEYVTREDLTSGTFAEFYEHINKRKFDGAGYGNPNLDADLADLLERVKDFAA